MSGLYNALFGRNPNSNILLDVLGLGAGDFGRFRDATLVEEEGVLYIDIFTRCGGGNREDYQYVFDLMEEHPCYISNEDSSFDSTYATIRFSIPEEYKEAISKLPVDDKSPMGKFQALIEDMQSGKSSPEVQKAMEVSKEILNGTIIDVGIKIEPGNG